MRLFTGIAPDPAVLNNLERALSELRPLAPLNWSPAENLHITIKFIGAWPEDRLEELKQALAGIDPPPPFAIAIEHFEYFPDPRRPRMFVAGVKAGPELAQLATRSEDALEPLGVAKETRPYNPHLTLARIGNHKAPALRDRIAKMTNTNFGSFEATSFHLYLSTPHRSGKGSVYTTLAKFPLASRVGSEA
jgi:2'-5' RNA ligase